MKIKDYVVDMDFIRKSITNTHKQEINLLSLSCYFLFVGVSGIRFESNAGTKINTWHSKKYSFSLH